jgi:SepF-like predicted cell division protein (DUF552 family)
MPAFGLFRKQKKQDQQEQTNIKVQETQQAQTAPEEPVQENKPETQAATSTTPEPQATDTPAEPPATVDEPEAAVVTPTQTAPVSKTYLKAMPLRELSDLENIKTEVQNGNILILRITPLASKSIESVKSAVNELYAFAESIGGDIARLGDERVVICPKNIRIWREKAPVKNEPLPTAA